MKVHPESEVFDMTRNRFGFMQMCRMQAQPA